MKRFLLVLLLLLPLLCPASAHAEESGYACILTADAFLYKDRSTDSGLFLLPQTYYVRILERGAEFCRVEYAADAGVYRAIRGYCRTSDLTFVSFIPSRPYVDLTLTLTYRLEGAPPSVGGVLSDLTVEAAYYGDYSIGSALYCYVLADGAFGYVPKPEISYELNDDFPNADAPAADADAREPTGILLIGILAAAVLILLCLTLRTPKRRTSDWYEDAA